MRNYDREWIVTKVHYDPETGYFTRVSDGRRMGRPDRKGYLIGSVGPYNYRLHRLAWLCMTGSWPEQEIDHINGVCNDNRWANLRECSHPQNNHNQGMRRSNTSGVKGVHWNRKARKWHIQVCLNYKIHHGGLFEDLAEAEKAVRRLREELHGEFANHG